jgi:hypothetical protein
VSDLIAAAIDLFTPTECATFVRHRGLPAGAFDDRADLLVLGHCQVVEHDDVALLHCDSARVPSELGEK